MRILIATIAAVCLIAPAQAATKKPPPATTKASAPLSPGVVPPNTAPSANIPSLSVVINPNSPSIPPLGQGTMATTSGVNLPSDQAPIPAWNVPSTGVSPQPAGLNPTLIETSGSLIQANIANGQHQPYKIKLTSGAVTSAWLRLYNAGTGFAGCNSATNLLYKAQIPAAAAAGLTGEFNDNWAQGMAGFTAGISVCISGAGTDTDTSAPPVGIYANFGWK